MTDKPWCATALLCHHAYTRNQNVTHGRKLGNAMNALGPQGREIQWAKRESVKRELIDIGVLPRHLVIAYSFETKGAEGNNKKGLPVSPWTLGQCAPIDQQRNCVRQELTSPDVLLCFLVIGYPRQIKRD